MYYSFTIVMLISHSLCPNYVTKHRKCIYCNDCILIHFSWLPVNIPSLNDVGRRRLTSFFSNQPLTVINLDKRINDLTFNVYNIYYNPYILLMSYCQNQLNKKSFIIGIEINRIQIINLLQSFNCWLIIYLN